MSIADLRVHISNLLNTHLWEVAGTPISVSTVLTMVGIVIAAYWLSRLSQQAIDAALRVRKVDDHTATAALKRLLHYLIMTVGLATAVGTVGIDMGALFAAGAVFAVGVGLAMQQLAQNFVSGVILLVERTVRPGDVLEVDGEVVRVEEMGIRSSVVRTRDNEDVILPNNLLVENKVINYTMGDRQLRVGLTVGVAYDSDMVQVEQVLTQIARGFPARLADREPEVFLTQFGSSSVDWEVMVWVDTPWNTKRLRSDLHQAVWFGLKKANIAIAFPQLDVHFDPHHVEQLAASR